MEVEFMRGTNPILPAAAGLQRRAPNRIVPLAAKREKAAWHRGFRALRRFRLSP